MSQIRFLVVSDIHTCDEDPSSYKTSSYVSTQGAGPTGAIEPISSMIDKVKAEVGPVDFVICAGDLTQRALPAGITYISEKLRGVATSLGAKHLVVVNGNHDVDSRFKSNNFDPRGQLRQSLPDMPFIAVPSQDIEASRRNHLEFFAEHLSIKSFGDVRVVAIDSAAFHGNGAIEDPEYLHGRISPVMLRALETRLKADTVNYSVNLLLCHHHPLNNNVPGELDSSEMDGGNALLELLDTGNFGHWFVIHGHKHRPRLRYAPGEVAPPIILSAASMSAQLADAQNRAPNQFHVVSFDIALAKSLSFGLAGNVMSWNWVPGNGWSAAAADGLPYRAGFGFRGEPAALAMKLATSFKAAIPSRPYWEWAEVVKLHPEVTTLMPRSLEQVLNLLETQHGIRPTLNIRHEICQLGVPANG